MKNSILVIFFCGILSPLFSFEFTLSYENKKIYYLDSTIDLRVSIENNSSDTQMLMASDNRLLSMDIRVVDLANRELPPSIKYLTVKTANQPHFVRTLPLEPGEEYSFTVSLDDFVSMEEAGVYLVEATLYPELKRENSVVSNRLYLDVRPSLGTDDSFAAIDAKTGEILKAEGIPPDEVVDYTVQALRNGNRTGFFLYVNTESFLLNDPRFSRRYKNSGAVERTHLLDEFKSTLFNGEVTGNSLIEVPDDYKIIRTTYTDHEAEVHIQSLYANLNYREYRHLIYHFRRDEGIWKITNLEQRSLSTERVNF